MGLMMGLMLPFMAHSETSLSLGFVLAHVAVLAAAAALALLAPRLRPMARRLLTHRPKLAHVPMMALGLALGWGAVCLYCLAILGEHH
jgi:hypothetical protein